MARFEFAALLWGSACFVAPSSAQTTAGALLELRATPDGTALSFRPGEPFHTTDREVVDPRDVSVAGSGVAVARWGERADEDAPVEPWYAIAFADGRTRVTSTDHTVRLGHGGGFDPLEGPPAFYARSPLRASTSVYLVQYETQPLGVYQDRIRELGGRVSGYLPHHVNLVRLSEAALERVRGEPFVRAVLPFHAEYRVEEHLLDRLGTGELPRSGAYNVWVLDRDAGDARAVAERIRAVGGDVRTWNPRSSLVGAMLTEEQLVVVLHMDEVLRVDRHTALEPDLNLVRAFSGADALELATGFSGQNVRGEVADTSVETTHPGFQHDGGVQLHGANAGASSHGTNVYGIVFGDGTGSTGGAGRGILPDAPGIFADADSQSWFNNPNPTNRAAHTAELVDPLGPYRGLFQTNSMGSSRTAQYNVLSANMDQIVFDNDLVIVQAQGNSGNPDSRPEAWAKNVVGVGGIYHFETLSTADDQWNFGASSGPAEDGRIKPELAHFYDSTLTATTGGGYASFGGSSGSTPITAAHFGLFFQLWHDGAFGNAPRGADPFDSKPHYETAVAAMINTAVPWAFSGQQHDLGRMNQGFGRVDVSRLYRMRAATVWADRERIDNLEIRAREVIVAAGEPLLKVTLVYRDLPGVPGSKVHRINDVSLRVVDPIGTEYHGNVGLLEGNASQPGGALNPIDTVENVWVPAPMSGTWSVEVVGVDVNTDLYPAVAGNNADYSLWITGAVDAECSGAPVNYCTAGTSASGCQASISAAGTPSATAASGFQLVATGVEGSKNGLFFFGTSGRQATPWGNGTSWRCVVPPVSRATLQAGPGTNGACDGAFAEDLNARWTAQPAQNPGSGSTVQAQLWHRDPQNTSNQKTAFSDAIEFTVCP